MRGTIPIAASVAKIGVACIVLVGSIGLLIGLYGLISLLSGEAMTDAQGVKETVALIGLLVGAILAGAGSAGLWAMVGDGLSHSRSSEDDEYTTYLILQVGEQRRRANEAEEKLQQLYRIRGKQ